MKQYDNRFVVAVLICLKEIIFHISSYLNFCVCKYTNFLFSTVGRNIAANVRRLGVGGGFTAVRTGDKLANSYKCFCENTPALMPNRLL